MVCMPRPTLYCTALSNSLLWLKYWDLSFSSTIEVKSWSVEFISAIETSNKDCVCTTLTTFYHMYAPLLFCCWECGKVLHTWKEYSIILYHIHTNIILRLNNSLLNRFQTALFFKFLQQWANNIMQRVLSRQLAESELLMQYIHIPQLSSVDIPVRRKTFPCLWRIVAGKQVSR